LGARLPASTAEYLRVTLGVVWIGVSAHTSQMNSLLGIYRVANCHAWHP